MPQSVVARRRPIFSRAPVVECLEARRLMAAGTFAFGAITYEVDEGSGPVNVSIMRTNGTDGAVDVTYRLRGGDSVADGATPNEDFTDVSGTVAFAHGEALKTVTIPITDDAISEGNESVLVELTAVNGGTADQPIIGGTSWTLVVIFDDDSPGVLSFSAEEYAVNEADEAVTLTVQRRGTLRGTVTAGYHIRSGNSFDEYPPGFAFPGQDFTADFTAATGTVTFADGQAAATFSVPILQDA